MSRSNSPSKPSVSVDAIVALAERFEQAALRGGVDEVEREGEAARAPLQARLEQVEAQLTTLAEESAKKDQRIVELQAHVLARSSEADATALEEAKKERDHQRAIELNLSAQKHEKELEILRLENALEAARIKAQGEQGVAQMKAEADKAVARETARDEIQGRNQAQVAQIQREAQKQVAQAQTSAQKKVALFGLVAALGGAALGVLGTVLSRESGTNKKIVSEAAPPMPSGTVTSLPREFTAHVHFVRQDPTTKLNVPADLQSAVLYVGAESKGGSVAPNGFVVFGGVAIDFLNTTQTVRVQSQACGDSYHSALLSEKVFQVQLDCRLDSKPSGSGGPPRPAATAVAAVPSHCTKWDGKNCHACEFPLQFSGTPATVATVMCPSMPRGTVKAQVIGTVVAVGHSRDADTWLSFTLVGNQIATATWENTTSVRPIPAGFSGAGGVRQLDGKLGLQFVISTSSDVILTLNMNRCADPAGNASCAIEEGKITITD